MTEQEARNTSYRCVLCGQSCDDMYGQRPPGTPARCRLHAWKNLGRQQTFSVEEARREGIKRASSLSFDLVQREGKIAYAQVEKWEQELASPEVSGSLRQYVLDVIAAKRAYLLAFD